MNGTYVETLLIGALRVNQGKTSTFVSNTMRRIQQLPSPTAHKKRFAIAGLRLTSPQFFLGMAGVVMAVSVIGFSGYAFAIGSDPVSLVKRIVADDKVKVEYQGRQFEHGVAQTYSDAAVTAYAELNTVEALAFAANNAGAIPKDGVAYLGTPYGYSTPYVYPTLGTITEVTDQSITIRQQYMLGDKTSASHDITETITISQSAELQFFKEAKQAAVTSKDIGRLVQIRQSQAVKHYPNSSKKSEIVTRYSVFALQHSLADFKAADKATTNPQNTKQLSTSGLIEKNFGGLSNRCLNNGADFCDSAHLSGDGESLYGRGLENSNRQVIRFGEGAASREAQPNLLLRNIYGTLTGITPETITIQGSSGSEWKLSFTAAQREQFKAAWGTELKAGDKLGGSILQGMNELDSRTIATDHIYNLLRIK